MPPEVQLLVIVIAFIGFWAIVIRPARNAQRRTLQLQQALEVGDRVIMSAGIFGTVVSLDDERVGLDIAAGTTITVARQAVVRRLEDESVEASGRETTEPAPRDEPLRDDTEE
ncbi:MAG TPA: preprotein translocase subunit YajC [Marmoricola sp.]|jgi:preprotein translocase subunit YajC|nr:preprotein translocase subunit YajC [Marmoricola sp.]